MGSDIAGLSARIAAAEADGGPEDGALLAARGGLSGPTDSLGAGEEHRLLRASIREFADREIRPQAQDIHRRDLDIPESIIRGASELGLFGLSVPDRYGGSAGSEPDHQTPMKWSIAAPAGPKP